jgi:AraC-like DNA-binding protein
MENYFYEKRFEYSEIDTFNLIYCGIREKCYGHKYNNHTIDNYILTYINEGRGEFNINGKKVILRENCFYVMYSKGEMSYVADPDIPWSISWIVTEGKQIEHILSAMGITREHPYIYVKDSWRVKSLYDEIFEKISRLDLQSKMKCLSLVYELLSVIAEQSSLESRNQYIDKALKYIHAHYCENINVQGLSLELGLSYNYFSKLFKRNTGVSPIQYINNLKINKAKFLLKNTDMQVGEIAEAVGCIDQFYFSRMFKRTENLSPIKYRFSE